MVDTELMALLDDLTRRVGETTDIDSVLESITSAARNSLDEIDHAGISVVHRDGIIETRAWTGDLVTDLDQLQYDLGEGLAFWTAPAWTPWSPKSRSST